MPILPKHMVPGTKTLWVGSVRFSFSELIEFQDRFVVPMDSDVTDQAERNVFAKARPLANRPLVLLNTPDPFRKARPCALQPIAPWSLVISHAVLTPEHAVVDLSTNDDCHPIRLVGALSGADKKLATPIIVAPGHHLYGDIILAGLWEGCLSLHGLLVRDLEMLP